jgi:hypothetical protein
MEGDSDLEVATISAGTIGYSTFAGTIAIGGTGGTLAFEWAQYTSDATDTTVREGSYLRLRKM